MGLDPEARREALLRAEPRVVEDLDRLIAGVERPELGDLAVATRESLEAYRGGLFQSSQALTAAVLSSAIHEHLEFRSHREAAKVFIEIDPAEAGLREFRFDTIRRAVAKALEDYDPLTGRPERSDFNRHATAHRVKEPQYSQINSLSALMLVASLLVELDALIAAEAERERLTRETEEALQAGPRAEHFDRVLRHGAGFVEEGEISTAGQLYAVTLASWLPETDPRAQRAQDLRTRWDEGEPMLRPDVEELKREIENLQRERAGDVADDVPGSSAEGGLSA